MRDTVGLRKRGKGKRGKTEWGKVGKRKRQRWKENVHE